MEQKNTDCELEFRIKENLSAKIPEPEILDQKLNDAYQQIRERNPAQKKHLPLALKCSAAAAALLLAMIYCVKNPALAAQLPLIGHIFSSLEEKVSYPGDYSKNSVRLPAKPSAEKNAAEKNTTEKNAVEKNTAEHSGEHADTEYAKKDTSAEDTGHSEETADAADTAHSTDTEIYTKKSGGITLTLSEVSYDSNAIYLAILAENEKEFASNLYAPDLLGFTGWVTMYKPDGSAEEFNDVSGTYLAYQAEGEYTDAHTFKGMIQFCSQKLDLTKYTACEITFTDFNQMLTTGKTSTARLPETNEEVTLTDHDIVHYKGNWKFRLKPELTSDSKQEVTINDTNEQGFGIEKVVRTKYEMYGVPILPEGEQWYDYIITIWDADGKPLDYHGSDFHKRAVYGRDVSQVTVYLLKWEDFEYSKGSNSYLQPSKAIYQTTVNFDEQS